MKKGWFIVLMGIFPFLAWGKSADAKSAQTIYEFKFKDIDEKDRDLSEYRGKVLLIANTASQCGFTGQYADLEKLYDEYKDRGLVVLGFPSNDFGKQEPGSNKEIKFFCTENYQVSFPLFAKSPVKGEAINPIFKYLTDQAGGGVLWNFEKFLVGRDGKFIDRWRSITNPSSKSIKKAVEKALAK